MNKLSDYESIKTLYERLSKEDPERQILCSTELEYGVTTFEGRRTQKDTFSSVPMDNWNSLNFAHANSQTTIQVICELLKPFATSDEHGNKPILMQHKLIKIPNIPKKEAYKLETTNAVIFSFTDMNPYNKFFEEFKNVSNVLSGEPDLILCWLKKKIPSGVEVYIVGTEVYIDKSALIFKYYRMSNLGDIKFLFTPDEQCPSILICKITPEKIRLLFGEFTNEDVVAFL